MKLFIENIAMVVGALWAMHTKEQERQYDYDNGSGEME